MYKKITLLMAIIGVFLVFKIFGLNQYLTFAFIKENQQAFIDYYQNHTYEMILYYSLVYIISTALSIPGATILTLLGGAIFGLPLGLLIISFTSSIGATLAFLMARFLLRDYVHQKFEKRLQKINDGIKKDGAFYLFSLRLVPIFPFFVINLAMGLTSISVIKFFLVSQIGMLAGTAVYVNAGVQLSKLDSIEGIMSPELIGSFILLGIFPLIAKKLVLKIKARRVYKAFNKPTNVEYNMVAIGAGSAGLVTSYISSAVKAKAAIIEKEAMGGDCLNTGCVPSKALIKSAKVYHQVNSAHNYGVNVKESSLDFAKAMERVQNVIKKIEPHDSVERYTELGVDCIIGHAQIISPWEVKVNNKIITTENITIATGASPFVPPIEGLKEIDYLTSNNLWKLRDLPKDLIILGAGPIGLEMAQSFNRFGSNVTVVEMNNRILKVEDEDVSDEVRKILENEGVKILTEHKAVRFTKNDDKNILFCQNNKNEEVKLEFDHVLVAVGRKANVKGVGLESLGVELRDNGTIKTNEFLQTNFPNIFACGDVTGPYQLTHMASHQAWYCAVNGLFGGFKKFKVDYSVVPWCTYLDPEVATVGKNEEICKQEGISYDVTKYHINDLDRAIAESEEFGFVKVLTKKGNDKIIGASIVGKNAGELITEFVSAMKYNKGLNSILGTIHSYPTMAEANKYAAGVWKKKNAPQRVLSILERYFRWRRS